MTTDRTDKTPIKVWHDDAREAPYGWERATTNMEALHLLKDNQVSEISLDHDLPTGDGLQLVRMMIRFELVPPKVTVHSYNQIGARRMLQELRDHGHAPLYLPRTP